MATSGTLPWLAQQKTTGATPNSQNSQSSSSVLTPSIGPSSIGVQAKSPTDNLSSGSTTLAGGQAKTQTPASGQSTSNGTQGYKAGQLTTYLQGKGMTADDNTLNSLATKYGIQGYQNNTTYNSQLLAKLQADGTFGTKPATTTTATAPGTAPAPAPTYKPTADLFGQLVTGLANTSTQPGQAYTAAQTAIQKNLADQSQLQQNFAEQNKNIDTSGVDLSLATGQEGVLGKLFAAKQAALTSQGAGLSSQLAAANTQQGLNQSALQQSATLAQPQSYGLTNQPYNPVTDTYGGGGTNGALNRAQLAGQIDATQQTASTQGQQVQAYKSALQQGQNLQAQLSDLITTFGLNPNDLNIANAGLQKIAKNVSDPHYKQFENYINDIANTYAQVLTPPGGSQTDTSRGIAASMLDATASGASILDTMKSLDNAAQAKIAGVATQQGTGNAPIYTSTSGNTYKLPY